MKLVRLLWVVRGSLLVLLASQCETQDVNPDVCQDKDTYGLSELFVEPDVESSITEQDFTCCVFPSNILNCSWSFPTLPEDTHISVYISVCDDDTVTWNKSTEERVGSKSLFLHQLKFQHVILQFNMSLNGMWTLYTYMYDMEMMEVLPPPSEVSASVKDGNLLVTWNLPQTRTELNPSCIEYELDLGDQERPRNVKHSPYTETIVDPTQTYRVRIRARRKDECIKSPEWSDWSQTVTMEQSLYRHNMLVIILISLGIPMILLAVLLLVRNQRVSELVFPPIPQPPSKYIYFLERNDTHSFFHHAQTVKAEEEIMEVEYVEENTGTKL